MTTFNADGERTTATMPEAAPANEQLNPPPAFDPDPDADPGIVLATDIEHPARPFREDEPRSEGAVERTAPDPQDDEPGTAVALAPRVDVSKLDEAWPHDWLEFKGDKLGIRLPTKQALAAFSLASSKYVSLGVKNDLTGLFIARHLSPESYGRVFSRLMDPDDEAYTVDTVGELFNAIVMASIDADKADQDG